MVIMQVVLAYVVVPIASVLLAIELIIFFILYSRKKIETQVPAFASSMGYWLFAAVVLLTSVISYVSPSEGVQQQLFFIGACTSLLVAFVVVARDIYKVWVLDDELRKRNRVFERQLVKK